MVEEKSKKVEAAEPPSQVQEKAPNRDSTEKALLLPVGTKSSSKFPPTQQKAAANGVEKAVGYSIYRDAALARVEIEKRFAIIKAWEDSEKTKAHNKNAFFFLFFLFSPHKTIELKLSTATQMVRAHKKLSGIRAWENTQRASVETQLKQIEEHFEKKKAAYAEKLKNQMADIHKSAQEKRAVVDAKRGQDTIKVEEAAEKFRATGSTPKKLFDV